MVVEMHLRATTADGIMFFGFIHVLFSECRCRPALYRQAPFIHNNALPMFTLQQVKDAHARVKSGADFPAYIQDMKALGVTAYDHYVSDGRIHYFGSGDYAIAAPPKYVAYQVTDIATQSALAQALQIHQQGGTDYFTFCKQAAAAGVEKWRVDTVGMTCTYYDVAGAAVLVEAIPVAANQN